MVGFDQALRLLKQGHRVARVEWNGRGVYLFWVRDSDHIDMRTESGAIEQYVLSDADVLAEDWVFVA